ncbi:MAG: hypothetical protein A3K65_09290 [Euryarchaeota archaeon RBG_16_68_12]|nr:MAG: hypothetical protein A3K65_09290 [Euryarchaeota archaeon RBG_16_68_12]
MKFLCDHMLGTLAKWLRFLGNDVAYPGPIEDNDLKAAVERDGRVLLTRDRELAGRVAGSLQVTSDDLDDQLLQVIRAFHLPADLSLSRCSLCNAPLEEVPKAEVAGKVPEKVFALQETFWHCPACGRFYWKGSHWTNMEARLRELRARAGTAESDGAGLEVRQFRREDLEDYTALRNAAEAGDPDYKELAPEDIRRTVLDDPSYDPGGHFVATEGGSLVAGGRGAYVPAIVAVRGPVAYAELFVLPAHQGTRVEREVFGEVVGYLRSRGAERIEVRADTRFTAKARQLERLGFSKSEYQNHGMERDTAGAAEPTPPEGYRIRVAGLPEEIEAMRGVMNEAFSTRERHVPMSLERFRRHWILEDPENHSGIFFAERQADGELVGTVMSAIDRKYNDDHGVRRGGTFALSVLPSERGKGLGTALLLQSLRWIADRGMSRAYLSVNVSNLDALGLYRSAGYRTVQVFQGYRLEIGSPPAGAWKP